MAHWLAAAGLTGLGPTRLERRAAVLAAVVLALLSAMACETSGGVEGTVTGHVVDVSAKSLLEIDVLTIEDDEGKEWSFSGRGYRGVSPSHLRQHMLQVFQVVVTYREEGDELIIREIRDYIPGATPGPHE